MVASQTTEQYPDVWILNLKVEIDVDRGRYTEKEPYLSIYSKETRLFS